MTKTLWSDEDGVIAIYEPHAYAPNGHDQSLWQTPDAHYFLTLEPDYKTIHAYKMLQEKHDLAVHVLTNLNDDLLFEEHRDDKIAWTARALPFLDMSCQFSVIDVPKCDFAKRSLGRPLTKSDILVSDYNNDLVPWENAGGTGVKYLNGINSDDSFHGVHIRREWSSERIRDFILSL